MSVRFAVPSDAAQLAEILIRSSRQAFSDFVSPQTLERCTDETNCRTMMDALVRDSSVHTLIAQEQSFLIWKQYDDSCEILAIHTLPCTWGTDLGHVLLSAALAQIDVGPVFLWAFRDNPRALRFYEKHGFRPDGSCRISEFDSAEEVRCVRELSNQ